MKSPHRITASFCRDVVDRLAAGESVRCDLPQGGHLHIDRQLPFLCVYRRPADCADTGTAALLSSQAAYLLAGPGTDVAEGLGDLVGAIAAAQGENFGAFLLLEVWAGTAAGSEPPPPGFRIVAPRSQLPVNFLEDMESELLRVRIADRTPPIVLDYRDSVTAPGMTPLLDEEQREAARCSCLGLEISPSFRHPVTEELFVFLHKKLRHGVSRALKRCFYEFMHRYTGHRPAHYHELGPRTITRAASEVDAKLAGISAEFDMLLFVSPVNSAAAWEEFKRHRYERTVEFLYRPRTIDPDLLKRRLYKIPIETVEDPTLAHIFTAKRDELDRQVTLLNDRNTARFLLGSRQLFGDVVPQLLELARDILDQPVTDTAAIEDEEIVGAEQFALHARRELEYYRDQDQSFASTVEIREDIPGIMVSHGNFLIGANAEFAPSRMQATLAHEIGTHALTYHNGRQQPLQELRAGMAGYEPLQEGLAVLSEYLVGELGAERLRQLAGRVLAVHMITTGADFIETFRSLHRQYGFDAREAFMMTMRTFRGGGYTKDAVYLQGLVEVLDYLATGKELLPLYLGKIAHEFLPLVEELRWRQVLRSSPLVPRLFELAGALEKIERLAGGMTVLDLSEEVS
jgi:uncharacterized protein (TIGR02421 family)